VLDEADRMLDMGFIHPIRRIAGATPSSRQTLLFSATMPREIVQLAHSMLREPVRVSVTPVSSAVPKIEQGLYLIDRNSKQALLEHLLREKSGNITRAIVFTKTKHGADRVGRKLFRAGISSETIHGNKAQNQRRKALDRFRSGQARVLVATDVAARGLDVDDISHVFNFDLPMEPEAYIHRIGRTGRAGATGIALSFCDREERGLLKDIEKLLGKQIPVQAAVSLPEIAAIPASPAPARPQHGHAYGPALQAPDQRPHHQPRRGPKHRPAHRGWHKPTRRASR
jgi:ATP-dependent RNA helicase RhlE